MHIYIHTHIYIYIYMCMYLYIYKSYSPCVNDRSSPHRSRSKRRSVHSSSPARIQRRLVPVEPTCDPPMAGAFGIWGVPKSWGI